MDKLSISKKIILSVCVVCVLVSLIVVPSSAADEESLAYTTWSISSDTVIPSGFGDYNISGYIHFAADTFEFSRLLLGYGSQGLIADSVAFYSGSSLDHWYLNDGDVVISFYSGLDVGNHELIQFLRNHCTQLPFDDYSENLYVLSGVRLFASNPDLSTFPLSSDVSGLTFVTGGVGYDDYSLSFISAGTRYLGIAPDFVGPISFTTQLVYTSASGWVDQEYRLVDFGTGTTVSSLLLYNWILNNSQDVTETADYERGLLVGIQQGIDSKEAKEKWYQSGYDEGLEAGINSSDSAALGQNLIGDTLSIPFRALDAFTLFEAPNGTTVTLGVVFGGMLGFVLLMAFLKLFAGG